MNRLAVIVIMVLLAISVLFGALWLGNKSKLTAKVAECDSLAQQHKADSAYIAALQESNTNKDNSINQLTSQLDSLYAQLLKSIKTISWLRQDIKKLEATRDSLLAVSDEKQSEIKLLYIKISNLADSVATLEKNLREQNASWEEKYAILHAHYIADRVYIDCLKGRTLWQHFWGTGKCLKPPQTLEGY